jgi:hypothetical protein
MPATNVFHLPNVTGPLTNQRNEALESCDAVGHTNSYLLFT